jgi:hypothetical protein
MFNKRSKLRLILTTLRKVNVKPFCIRSIPIQTFHELLFIKFLAYGMLRTTWLLSILKLTSGQIEKLNNLTQPKMGFPQNMMPIFPALHNAGTSVNGVYGEPSPFAVMPGDKQY